MANPSEPVNSRVYVGGLGKQATKQDVEDLFKDFQPYRELTLLRGYAFIQFYDAETASSAIQLLNGKMINDRKLSVKIANDNRSKKGMLPRGTGGPAQNANIRDRSPIDAVPRFDDSFIPNRPVYHGAPSYGGREIMPAVHPPAPPSLENNDCEIIVVSRDLTKYAENIESRLKRAGLTVDLLFPNDDVPIGKVLSNIASRGSLYAILITPENQERNSITVNVLYGIPAEHRNMPTDDAIMFIAKNFQERLRAANEPPAPLHQFQGVNQIAAPPPPSVYNSPSLQDKHPDAIQNMVNLLAANRQLTVLQYNRLISYLNERKELQIRYELGDDIDSTTANQLISPATTTTTAATISVGAAAAVAAVQQEKSKAETEKELQKKILDILNKPSIVSAAKVPVVAAPTEPSPVSSIFDSKPGSGGGTHSLPLPVLPGGGTPKLLHDPKVQKALDSLLQGNIFSNLGGGLKF